MRRVKASVSAVWWFNFSTMWLDIGRAVNGLPPMYDSRGYAWFQAEYNPHR